VKKVIAEDIFSDLFLEKKEILKPGSGSVFEYSSSNSNEYESLPDPDLQP
jgi:hypothetical protein